MTDFSVTARRGGEVRSVPALFRRSAVNRALGNRQTRAACLHTRPIAAGDFHSECASGCARRRAASRPTPGRRQGCPGSTGLRRTGRGSSDRLVE